MNFLGYTSTSSLREKEELVEKLLDANKQFYKANNDLKSKLLKAPKSRDDEIHGLKQQIDGLRQECTKLSNENTRLNESWSKLAKSYDTSRTSQKQLLKQYAEASNSIEELEGELDKAKEELKKVNERYDAFVTVSSTNFASHVDRVLKKRKVGE
jgi:uncharacterized coiled-coil DUF342 family protein